MNITDEKKPQKLCGREVLVFLKAFGKICLLILLLFAVLSVGYVLFIHYTNEHSYQHEYTQISPDGKYTAIISTGDSISFVSESVMVKIKDNDTDEVKISFNKNIANHKGAGVNEKNWIVNWEDSGKVEVVLIDNYNKKESFILEFDERGGDNG